MRKCTALLIVAMAARAGAQNPPVYRVVSPNQTAYDSSGIRVYTNLRPRYTATTSPRLNPKPELVIGTQPGERYELAEVAGAIRLESGGIVVADGSTNQLRFFDSTGKFLKATGRRGRGPGEFERMSSLSRAGRDTLAVVHDRGMVSFFSGDGRFIKSTNLHAPAPKMESGILQVLAVIDIDRLLVASLVQPKSRGAGERWVDSVNVAIVGPGNEVLRSLGRVPSMELVMTEYPRPPWMSAPFGFAATTSSIYLGLASEYAIRSYDHQGRQDAIIRRGWEARPITDADIDFFVTEWSKRWIKSTGARAEQERKALRESPFARRTPAFSEFRVDRADRLWVRDADIRDAVVAGQLNGRPLAGTTWTVFDTFGSWLYTLAMPARLMPTDIGANYVLGVNVDADGVERVELYRLQAGNPAR